MQHAAADTPDPASLRVSEDVTSVAAVLIIEEDHCGDAEGVHTETEGLAYLALSGSGQAMLRAVPCNPDPSQPCY